MQVVAAVAGHRGMIDLRFVAALFRRRGPATRAAVAVRAADTRDLDEICAMLEELVADKLPRRSRKGYLAAIREEQRRMLLEPDAAWFVAERGGAIVGCARVNVRAGHPLLEYLDRRDAGYVFGVFVRGGDRRDGAGRALLARCEKWLVARGVRWVFLHSTPPAMGFYETLGYEATLEFAKKL